MICVRNLGFRYRESDELALRDVNLEIPDGSFVGVTGAASSGKSTLTYALNGIVPHCYAGDFYGSVLVGGLDTAEASLTDISRLVGSVCQDIDSQMVSPVVEDEVLYGLENFGVPRDEAFSRVREVAGALGISDLLKREISSLSGGQKQKVAIASILVMRPQVLVLDEPTAELDPAASRAVFELLRGYTREHGITVVVVEQKIALLADFSDMLVVMEGGRIRFAAHPDKVLEHADELLAMGVNVPRVTSLTRRLRRAGCYDGPVCRTVDGAVFELAARLVRPVRADGPCFGAGAAGEGIVHADVPGEESLCADVSCEGCDRAFRPGEAPQTDGSYRPGEALRLEGAACAPTLRPAAFEFHGVIAGYDDGSAVLRGIDLSVAQGEFVAFAGTNGAGKSTAMRLINGLLKPREGDVAVLGRSTRDAATSDLARDVGFLFQNPDRQICKGTVRDELAFGFEALGISDDGVLARIDAAIEEFGLDPDADPFLLSRGARQLVALASIAVLEPRIVVLDEPTTGLDFLECEKVMRFVVRLHEKGATIVMVCHDMELVADYAERVVVMSQGRVVADGPVFEIMRDDAILQAASMAPSQMADVSERLVRAEAVPACSRAAKANTLDELSAALEELLGDRAAGVRCGDACCGEARASDGGADTLSNGGGRSCAAARSANAGTSPQAFDSVGASARFAPAAIL